MKIRYSISTLLALFMIAVVCNGQQADGKSGSEIKSAIFSRSAPAMFNKQFNALGKRMKDKGKERTLYEGLHIDASGREMPARVTHQRTGQLRMEGIKGQDSVLSYDGESSYGITSSRQDESLIELFVSDTPEGMFTAIQNGAAVQFLGGGFGPDPEKEPNYTGPRFDIYEVIAPIVGSNDNTMQRKKYYFDSESGLLHSTRYYDRSVSPPIKIETRFSYWGNIEGSEYPAQIERYEDGRRTFFFIANKIESGTSEAMESFNR